ncbi:hypothetical protein B14911_06973 [Bacillus sp. NRRL B-14911]|nr:hypothetical protein B14911_06973 [Bacillus sp. NRRL B-14911]
MHMHSFLLPSGISIIMDSMLDD